MGEFFYRTQYAALGHFPGAHCSQRGESGYEFRGHARLIDAPDVRRLDLRASLRDPFGDWTVRVYSQRRAIDVMLVADLSASMAFQGALRRQDVLADFVDSLAWSASRSGDRFGFVGCGKGVREDWLLPATRSRGAGRVFAERLRRGPLDETSSAGLLEAQRYLGRRRALVFLVSDFHFDLALLERLLGGLAHHELVPVVMWDPLEAGPGARRGLATLHDAESGAERLVWWRPALRERWAAQGEARRAALAQVFERHHLKPMFIEAGFDADAVTRHFFGR